MTPSSTAAADVATNTYSTTAEIRHAIRPWFDDFLSSFTLPLSFHELSLRLQKNLYTFRGNYTIISLLIFILTLIFRPIAAIVFLLIIAAWIYLFFARDEPLVVFDFEIGDRLVLISLTLITIVSVAVSGVWWNLFLTILISALLICLHAILRTPDDIESPYGALLSVVDEDGASRGSYMQV
ncbi:PRA1 family protein D-like [Cynara cardunculus var. scolymus]|uniref:PRA1 family protein D-like n=1 Tax=Cynara cardunculus var. scolymus TaxID=59895 RepID=UPI000D62921B|nr:PRA1 family protein D-like [Cynara cardunculus var. scolymus]